MSAGNIRIVGAHQNNLKNVSLELPLNELIVISGVSGSGKSSLAFDTLYAEGQRRYVESFSAYARQFLERMDKPRVERIEGIPPAIAIDQSNPVKNSRSTVGTMTELTDHIRLLFAKIGQLYCRQCKRPVVRSNASDIVGTLLQHCADRTVMISFPYGEAATQKPEKMRRDLQRLGFTRLLVDGKVVRLDADTLPATSDTAIEVLVDRIKVHDGRRARLVDSLEQALRFGQGMVIVRPPDGDCLKFSQHLHCPECNITYRDAVPNLFSFNSPLGACDTCQGFGRTSDIDLDLIIPDPRKSLEDGAIKAWSTPATRRERRTLLDFCVQQGIPTDVPFARLGKDHKRAIIDGQADFYGIRGWFRWLETKTYRMYVRIFLAKYRSYITCTDCNGSRLKAEALLTRIRGKYIAEVYAMPVASSSTFFHGLADDYRHDRAMDLLLGEICSRLDDTLEITYNGKHAAAILAMTVSEALEFFDGVVKIKRPLHILEDAGLGYLTLGQPSNTLSGGEAQRIKLAYELSRSAQPGTLYILDEPTTGLHLADIEKLMHVLQSLVNQGNTVVVIEHNLEVIRQADYILDLGPEGGEAGGQVVVAGSPEHLMARPETSYTARFLREYLNDK